MYKTRLSIAADEDGLAGQHGVGAPLERVDHGLPLAAAVVQKRWARFGSYILLALLC